MAYRMPRARVRDIQEQRERHHCEPGTGGGGGVVSGFHHSTEIKDALVRTCVHRQRNEENAEGRKAESGVEQRAGCAEDHVRCEDLENLP